jgi:hypothetical protein
LRESIVDLRCHRDKITVCERALRGRHFLLLNLCGATGKKKKTASQRKPMQMHVFPFLFL